MKLSPLLVTKEIWMLIWQTKHRDAKFIKQGHWIPDIKRKGTFEFQDHIPVFFTELACQTVCDMKNESHGKPNL